jgi:uncharacterized protein
MALVLDTGVIYSALNEEDPDHGDCAGLLESANEQLVIPHPVLVEVDYWVNEAASVDVWLAFCEDVAAGAYSLWSLDPNWLLRAAELQARYSDQPIGFVDAAVFTTCEALGEDKVATLDRRHFSVLRTKEGRTLRILPGT